MLLQESALRSESAKIQSDWGAGGTYRQILSALTAAASGNVSGGSGQFTQGFIVNYIQQQGAGLIGNLVANGTLKEGSAEHAALHAIVACAGASASNQSCSSAAMATATASFLTNLFSDPKPNETNAEREGMHKQEQAARSQKQAIPQNGSHGKRAMGCQCV